MIANALRVEIERAAARMKLESPLYLRAADGSLTPAIIGRYLTSLREILRETPPSLARARDRAFALGDLPLSKHYAEKLAEEIGHHEWAESDLKRLSSQTRLSDIQVLPSVETIVAFQRATIDEDPALYLAYTLFAEYLVVILAPSWLELLESNCGIAVSSMTALANHVEADADHVEETLESIDGLVGDPRKLPRMREILSGSIANFETFCREILDDRRSEANMSAA